MWLNIESNKDIKATLALIALFSLLVSYHIPVDDTVKDKVNYSDAIEYSASRLASYMNLGWMGLVANEPAWVLLTSLLKIINDTELALRLTTFVALFAIYSTTAILCGRHYALLIIILTLPMVASKFIIHLRQGLAIGIFMYFWMKGNDPIRVIGSMMAALMHSSFFPITALLSGCYILKRLGFSSFLNMLLMSFFSLVVIFMLNDVAALVGARQATYHNFSRGDVSGIGFLVWLGVLLIYYLQGNEFIRKNIEAVVFIIFYLLSYFTISLAGRIFESVLIVVLLAAVNSTPKWRAVLVSYMLVFSVLLWVVRFDQPFWGLGV